MAQRTNATGDKRKFWGTIPVLPGRALMDMGKQMEDVGFEGAFALQIYGPPFGVGSAQPFRDGLRRHGYGSD
jgi:hypothetical protein